MPKLSLLAEEPKVHLLLKVAFSQLIFLAFIPFFSVHADVLKADNLIKLLNKELNNKITNRLNGFLSEVDFSDLKINHKRISKQFPNSKWLVRESKLSEDKKRKIIEIIVSGNKSSGDQKYFLNAKKILEVDFSEEGVISKKILSQESIIQKGEKPLPISINIPDIVLTGTTYDVDIILKEPLQDAILAGGLTAISPNQILRKASPGMDIKPLGGGGLFKSVKAPLYKGYQTWGAVLAHPDALIYASKMVRVVANSSEIDS